MTLVSTFANNAKGLAVKAYDFVVSGYLGDVWDSQRLWGRYGDAKKTEGRFGKHKDYVAKLQGDAPDGPAAEN